MFGTSYKVARVFGIPIKADISLLVILLMLVFDLGLVAGVLYTLMLATSIALHELGHSLVAIRKGCRVREITLTMIGGVAQLENMPDRPGDEAQVAIAGPAVSFVLFLAGFFGGAYLPLPPRYLLVADTPPINLVQVMGLVNLMLVLFNLLPSFPMDGGRVFRAVLTRKHGRVKATFIAARLGKIMAIFFAAFGLLHTPITWSLVFIAVFIFMAAGQEYRMVVMQERMRQRGGPFPPGWAPFASPWRDPDPEDRVIISPPPYSDGPAESSDLHSHDSDDDNPFRNLFGR